MENTFSKILIFSLSIFCFGGHAVAIDSALTETQNVLVQPERRIEVIKTNPGAQKIDSQVRELMGEHTEDIYKLSSDFLPYVLQLGRGDPTKMAEILTQATRNPAAFANNLPADLKQKLSNTAQKVKPLPEQRKP